MTGRTGLERALLRVQGASRDYGGRTALHGTDLEVGPGACVVLVGPNGSGKSTLLRLASGRERPTSGTVEFDGRPADDDDPRVRCRVAVVGTASAWYPDLSVRQHLELTAVGHGVPDADARIDRLLAEHRLLDHADVMPGTLSSGQQQAMLLAAALVRPRDLLILDEPEQRLDPSARGRLAVLLRAERRNGTAVLFATHDHALARAVADTVLVLADGSVVARGHPEDVLSEGAG